MKAYTSRLGLFAAVLVLVVGATSGCKSSGGQKSSAAVQSMASTRDELAKGVQQVDADIAAANALRGAQADLRMPYNELVRQIKLTEEQAKRIRSRATDMRKRAEEYQKKWQEEVAQMQNPTLRAAATQRAVVVRDRYASIRATQDQARAAYAPFITNLKDLEKYVSHDMTPAAVSAAAPMFDKISADGTTLKTRLNALIAELDSVAAAMSPTSTAPARN